MIREVPYLDLTGCFEIANSDARLIVSTGFGPRVLFYGLDGGENVFGWHPEAAVETQLGTWKPYGGHRLWAAPENMPLSYAPDNSPVEVDVHDELSLTVTADIHPATQLQKRMSLSLASSGAGVTVDHRIKNCGDTAVEIAAWALTIMRSGGVALVPNEPLGQYGGDNLLPVRSMALWPYTDFTDPRWKFEKDSIRLRCDESFGHPQKFGVLNKQGWAAYEMDGLTFTKRFEYVDAAYPDMNSNTEIYTAGGFMEVETLSPMRNLEPGENVEHQERWDLVKS